MKFIPVFFILILGLKSCTQQSEHTSLFTLVPHEKSGIDFKNVVENSDELNIFNYRNFYNGGGVAIGDINNDGLADILFTGNTVDNRLYLNKGNLEFEDVTPQALPPRKGKWSTGVLFVDVNADGWLDIYVCNAGYLAGDTQENELYINNRDLTFTEQAAAYGLNNNGYTTHAAFFDYDLDGDLDAYILNNSFIPVNTLNLSDRRDLAAENWPVKDFLKKGGDQLLRNDNGHFTDVTKEAGIYNSLIGFGLGVTVGYINQDRLPDIYISNDFYERDYMYINKGDGTFSDEILHRTDHISLSSMGADMADLNNDTYSEIFVTDMLPDEDSRLRANSTFESYSVYTLKQQRNFHHQYMQNTLQLNNGNGSFSEIANYAGVAATDWSWGALLFDMDLDGWKDLYVCNGIQHDVTDQDFIDFFADDIIQKMALTGRKEEIENVLNKMPSNPILNKAFKNKGEMKFEDVSASWFPAIKSFSNGAAYGDLDNDGDLDLVVNNVNQNAFLFQNNQHKNNNHHFISIKLKGPALNQFGIGSTIHVHAGAQVFSSDVIPSRGFQSSVDYTSVIGLGLVEAIDSLVIWWPDSGRSVLASPVIDTVLTITYSDNISKVILPADTITGKLFKEISSPFLSHREEDFVDFYSEGLLMHKLSNEGPAYARGDINNDNFDDLIIGGAANQSAMIYFGSASGWHIGNDTGLENEKDFEDVAAVLSDLDNDTDLDLVMGSGGNNDFPKSRVMQDRIYLNDGQGKFQLSPNALPPNGFNTSAIAADDIDSDGDIDLIICSRSIPGNYGPPPPSYVYLNDGKANFKDGTNDVAPEFMFAGMLTDIELANIAGDDKKEWIVTREWGSPLIFTRSGGKYVIHKTVLENYPGWWMTVETADLDVDGDLDLVLGNRGENFYMSGQSVDEYKLWISDFDKNGTVENFITRTIDQRDVPVPMKKELTEQLTFLKKKNLKHQTYAQNSIQDLLPADLLDNALVLNSRYHSSVIAWNNKGEFSIEKLPFDAQLSCICAINVYDINNDKMPEILLGGNNYGFTPQFSRLDAFKGIVLQNSGNNKWVAQSSKITGWQVKGQLKSIDIFSSSGVVTMVNILNNEKPRVFIMEQMEDL